MRNRLFFAVLASTTLLLTDLPSHSYEAGGGDDNGNSDTVAIGDDAETKDDALSQLEKMQLLKGRTIAIGSSSDVDGKNQ